MDKARARKSLRKSIKHWCIDIRKPFFDGDSIFQISWKEKGTIVKMFSNSCNLCATYKECNGCPLVRIDDCCDSDKSAYSIFYDNRDLKSVNNMISTLIKAYKEVL